MNTLTDIEIFSAGLHNGDTYTIEDLDAMVSAFDELDFKPPLKSGHVKDKPGMPALGWIANLRRSGSKLLADFTDMPAAVYDAIKRKAYDNVSAEIWWDLPRAGKTFKRALKAVALLGADIPAVAGLKPLHEMFEAETATVHYAQADSMRARDAAGDELDTLTKKRMAAHPQTYHAALHAVMEEHPDLKRLYIKGDIK